MTKTLTLFQFNGGLLKRFSSREVRQAVVGRGNLYTLLSDKIEEIDPYNPEALTILRLVYKEESYRAWLSGKNLFSGLCDDIGALENLWASLQHLQDILDFIFKGVTVEGNANVINRARQLVSRQPVDSKTRLHEVLFENGDDLVPDLLPFMGFSSRVRLRWGLAARVQKLSRYIELYRCAGSVKRANAQEAFELLSEAIRHYPQGKFNNSRKLTEAEIIATSDVEFEFFSRNELLTRLSCAKPIKNFSEELASLDKYRDKYKHDFKGLSAVLSKLSDRQWREAGSLAEPLCLDRIIKVVASNLREAIDEAKERAECEWPRDSWSQMSPLGYENIVHIFGRKVAKPLHKLSEDEIASRLISGELNVQSLSISDIKQLDATWGVTTKQNLLDAKQYKVFLQRFDKIWESQSVTTLIASSITRGEEQVFFLSHYLPDQINGEELIACLVALGSKKTSFAVQEAIAIKVRSKTNQWGQCSIESWDEIISSEIGTHGWSSAIKKGLVKKPTFSQLIFAVKKGSKNCNLKGFQEKAVAILEKLREPTLVDVIGLMVWFDRRPSDARFLAPHLKAAVIARILDLHKRDCTLKAVRALHAACETPLKPKFWRMQLNYVANATDLIELGIEGIKNNYPYEWNSGWRSVSGSKIERAQALVLMARNDIVRLKRLRDIFTEEELAEAILWLSKHDVFNTYEAIFFELTAFLGLRHAATLKWLLHKRNLESPLGYRFEKLYSTYEIPKKSGKSRVICAPNSSLKSLQKAVVIRLIYPLGVHKSVYGFVRGRSIVDNAQCHVNKDVVVSVDIRDCFPSVKWPLILSVLRRDLGCKLRQETLLFLLDLCTKDGRLPTGAPTSPSLLNRVLNKTDEILHEQAYLRGYTYTRYADDLTFSGDKNVSQMIGVTRGVLNKINLELDPKKTNIFRRGRRQLCTGLVVNEKVSLPRKVRRRLRAAVHAFEADKGVTWSNEVMTASSLRGRLEFFRMVSPRTASSLVTRYDVAYAKKQKKDALHDYSPTKRKSSR